MSRPTSRCVPRYDFRYSQARASSYRTWRPQVKRASAICLRSAACIRARRFGRSDHVPDQSLPALNGRYVTARTRLRRTGGRDRDCKGRRVGYVDTASRASRASFRFRRSTRKRHTSDLRFLISPPVSSPPFVSACNDNSRTLPGRREPVDDRMPRRHREPIAERERKRVGEDPRLLWHLQKHQHERRIQTCSLYDQGDCHGVLVGRWSRFPKVSTSTSLPRSWRAIWRSRPRDRSRISPLHTCSTHNFRPVARRPSS